MDKKNARVGVIGLGIMGGTFARQLVQAGVRTLGYDPLVAPLRALEAAGGQGLASARAVAADADLLITSLPHVKAFEEALFGTDGVVFARRPGLLIIETSTLVLEAKEAARARLAASGIAMLDAPISGTGSQAQAKDITIFASGERSDFERARMVLEHIARSVRYVGAFGSGSKLKYIANLLVAVHILAAAEALVLGEKAGFAPADLVDLLVNSAFPHARSARPQHGGRDLYHSLNEGGRVSKRLESHRGVRLAFRRASPAFQRECTLF
jgi:3-hydroxyisobutyrate dehydrogenase